jgi:hypothetical protein
MMTVLALSSVESCIMAAYGKYLTDSTGTFTVNTGDGDVQITCAISGTNFNCGFPGYQMPANQSDNLKGWCTTHPGSGWSFGFRGRDHDHPDSVNVTLINKTPKMFNFHVYLS